MGLKLAICVDNYWSQITVDDCKAAVYRTNLSASYKYVYLCLLLRILDNKGYPSEGYTAISYPGLESALNISVGALRNALKVLEKGGYIFRKEIMVEKQQRTLLWVKPPLHQTKHEDAFPDLTKNLSKEQFAYMLKHGTSSIPDDFVPDEVNLKLVNNSVP